MARLDLANLKSDVALPNEYMKNRVQTVNELASSQMTPNKGNQYTRNDFNQPTSLPNISEYSNTPYPLNNVNTNNVSNVSGYRGPENFGSSLRNNFVPALTGGGNFIRDSLLDVGSGVAKGTQFVIDNTAGLLDMDSSNASKFLQDYINNIDNRKYIQGGGLKINPILDSLTTRTPTGPISNATSKIKQDNEVINQPQMIQNVTSKDTLNQPQVQKTPFDLYKEQLSLINNQREVNNQNYPQYSQAQSDLMMYDAEKKNDLAKRQQDWADYMMSRAARAQTKSGASNFMNLANIGLAQAQRTQTDANNINQQRNLFNQQLGMSSANNRMQGQNNDINSQIELQKMILQNSLNQQNPEYLMNQLKLEQLKKNPNLLFPKNNELLKSTIKDDKGQRDVYYDREQGRVVVDPLNQLGGLSLIDRANQVGLIKK